MCWNVDLITVILTQVPPGLQSVYFSLLSKETMCERWWHKGEVGGIKLEGDTLKDVSADLRVHTKTSLFSRKRVLNEIPPILF